MKHEDVGQPPDPLPVEGLAAGEAARHLEQAQRAKFHSPVATASLRDQMPRSGGD